jgi:hypothetical protein
MNNGSRPEEESRVSETISGTVQRVGSDPTPPPDHADFVEVRSAGLRAVRENLARRRKVPVASPQP